MSSTVTVQEEIYTHEYLWRSSSALVQLAEGDMNDYKLLIPALLMNFMAFEAFVNFLGHVLAPELWTNERENFKGKGLEGRLGAIVKRMPTFCWMKGADPYQAVKRIEAFRDMVAHGKVIATKYSAERRDDGSHFRFEHKWDDHISFAAVEQARASIKAFSQALLEAARTQSDDRHLFYDAYEGTLAHASGSSKVT